MIKVANSQQIVGGYNPFSWGSSNTYKSTKDSFVFSFTNKDNLQSAKVGYSNGDEYSVGSFADYGPLFGAGNYLFFYNSAWHSNPSSSYAKVDMPANNFKADDYEVFQVIKK